MFASSFVASDVAATFRTASVSHKRSCSVAATAKMSRIGKQVVQVPDKVKVTINGNTISVKVREPILVSGNVFQAHFAYIPIFQSSMQSCGPDMPSKFVTLERRSLPATFLTCFLCRRDQKENFLVHCIHW